MSKTQASPRRLVFRWTTLKGLISILLFILIATLIELAAVLYALNLGVEDKTILQWSFQFPGTNWAITVVISPLFHLIPVAVVITLASSWTYLMKHVAVKTPERKGKIERFTRKGKSRELQKVRKSFQRVGYSIRSFFGRIKSGLLKIKAFSYFWQKVHFARAAIKSAITVLLVFIAFFLLISLLGYPQLIYRALCDAYQNNSSLLGFVKSTGGLAKGIADALVPVGWLCSVVNSALLAAAPGFRNFVLSIGALIKPLVDLDDVGKYIVIQNVAAWMSALIALFYGEYTRKSYRYRRR